MNNFLTEEPIVVNEYKHLNILHGSRFVQGALVNAAKIEYRNDELRYYATLEGRRVIDTDWVPRSDYSHVIVEDDTTHHPALKLSDIKVGYRLFIKASNDNSISPSDKQSILRLIVIFGNYVKWSMDKK